jgi:hypothetical protein
MSRLIENELNPRRLIPMLRQTQAMRDELDDGLPPDVQQQARARRAELVDQYEAALLRRHAELRAALGPAAQEKGASR